MEIEFKRKKSFIKVKGIIISNDKSGTDYFLKHYSLDYCW